MHPVQFWSDFQYLLDRAQHYGIGLIPVLWDFHAMDDVGNMPYTPSQHGHKDLFSNEALVTSYIDLALIPLVSKCAVLLLSMLVKVLNARHPCNAIF